MRMNYKFYKPQKFIINANRTVKTLSNIRFIFAGVQISDRFHVVHSLHNGHIRISSFCISPHIRLLKV